jgi:dienelactone hydrolase
MILKENLTMRVKKSLAILVVFLTGVFKIDALECDNECYRSLIDLRSSSVKRIEDPYLPYLKSIPPVLQTLSIKNSGSGEEAITTKRIIFSSKNGANKVYGILSSPLPEGKYPGIMILHGGSGNADGLKSLVENFARKGYVALTFDMPGVCGTTITPNSEGLWKLRPEYDEGPRFNVAKGPENSILVDAEVAGIEAFNLLCSDPNVDMTNVGITGYSWGGYSTTFLAGILGSRVKAAYSVFGCGYYELGSFWKNIIEKMSESDRNVWLEYIDAGRRVKKLKADFFLEATTNDTYFWPEAVNATMSAIPGHKNMVWYPNLNHVQSPDGEKMQELYFDYYLKGIGSPFGTIGVSKIKLQNDGSKEVMIKVKIPESVSVVSVSLYFSEQGVNWQSRTWVPIKAELESHKKYSVLIPAEIANKKINFYVYMSDSRNVITSSKIY